MTIGNNVRLKKIHQKCEARIKAGNLMPKSVLKGQVGMSVFSKVVS